MGTSPSTGEAAAPALDLNCSADEHLEPSPTDSVPLETRIKISDGSLDSVTSAGDWRLDAEAAAAKGLKKESSTNGGAGQDSMDERAKSPEAVVDAGDRLGWLGLGQDTAPEAADQGNEQGAVSLLVGDGDSNWNGPSGDDAREVGMQFFTPDRPADSFTSAQSEINLLDPHDKKPAAETSVWKDLEQPEEHTAEAEEKSSLGFDKNTESAFIKLDESHPVGGYDAANVVTADGDPKVQPEEQEQLTLADRKLVKQAGLKQRASIMGTEQCAAYELPGQEAQEGFSVSELVWGKVRSHPWWPGQIYDPKDASEMAMKVQKKGRLLVAYFGDKTFAWCKESQLKPFQPHFSQMEKQSSVDAFVNALNAVLEEVRRHIELGMTCFCVPEEAYIKLKEQKVENAGIWEGTSCLAVDRCKIVGSFQPDRFIDSIRTLAVSPCGGADRLELVIAKAQLKTFYQSRGYTELPVFLVGGGLLECDAEISPSRVKQSQEGAVDHEILTASGLTSGQSKSRGRRSSSSKKKNIVEDGRKKKSLSELMEEKYVSQLANGGRNASGVKSASRSGSSSGKKRKVVGVDSGKRKVVGVDLGKRKRKRLDSLGDLEEAKAPSPTVGRSLKVGDSIRRAASQIAVSPPIFKSETGSSQRSSEKVGRRRSHVGTNDMPGSSVETRGRKRGVLKDYPLPSEVLSQLCLAARDPMKGYSFLSVVVSFFTDFRDTVASGFPSSSSKDKKHVERTGGGKGRKRLAYSKTPSSETSTLDYMQDSYWSDIIFKNSPEKEPSSGRKRKGQSQAKKQKKKKKKKTAGKSSPSLPSGRVLNTSQEMKVGSGSPDTKEDSEQISNSGEQVGEYTPTALILSFTESNALPSETELIKIFSHYGPLNESETEVSKRTNYAKVVFKKSADAEIAFSSAGKYSIFGPALVSYRLKYLSSTSRGSPNSMPQGRTDTSTIEGVDLEAAAEEETGAVSDNMQVEAGAQGASK